MEGEQKTGRLFGKQLLGNLALSVAAILVALVIGEVFLRSFFKRRMYRFCRQNDIRLVILDIPQVSQGGEIQSSVPSALYEKMRANRDLFIYSKEALHEYRNVAEFHVPHGHHHLSEFTHLIYGVEVARALANSHKSNKLHLLKWILSLIGQPLFPGLPLSRAALARRAAQEARF